MSFPMLRFQTPTYADLYCAGFISKQTLPDANYVAGGLQTPTTTKFSRGDIIFLKGTGYTPAQSTRLSAPYGTLTNMRRTPGKSSC